MDCKIISVLIVFCINLWELGETNSFFQVPNIPSVQGHSQVSIRRSPFSFHTNDATKNTTDATQHGELHSDGAQKGKKHRKGRKSNRTRTGRKKSHKKRNKTRHAQATKAPKTSAKHSEIELFDLQELSPAEDKELSFHAVNEEMLNTKDKLFTSDELKEVGKLIGTSSTSTGSRSLSAPQKDIHPGGKTHGKSLKTENTDLIFEGNDMIVTLAPGKHTPGNRSKFDVPRTKTRLSGGAKGRGIGGDNADGGPFIDFPISKLRQGADPGAEAEAGAGEEEPELDDISNRVITPEIYEKECSVKENEERKRRCETQSPYNPNDGEQEDYKDTSNNVQNLLADKSEPSWADNVVTGEIHHVAQQNRKLALALIKMSIWPTPEVVNEPKNGFKFLNTTKSVFNKVCPPNLISPKFLQSVVQAFKLLHDITTPARTPFINDVEYDMIDKVLQQCLSTVEPPGYIQNDCKEEVIGVQGQPNLLCLGYMMSKGRNLSTACYQTNIEIFDPVLDIVWIMFETVKATCFNFFQGNVRLYHRYSVAIMDLFTRPLKYRWGLQRESKEFWERILGPTITLGLVNLDKCAHYVLTNSKVFDSRTPRYMNIHSLRLSHTFTDFIAK